MKITYSIGIGGYCCILLGCVGPLDVPQGSPGHRSFQMSRNDLGNSNSWKIYLSELDSLSVEDAIRLAIQHNPRLVAARHQVDAASGVVYQAGFYPNPTLSIGVEALGSDAGSAGETSYVVEQEFKLGSQLRRAKDLARSDQLASIVELESEKFSVAAQVSRTYYDALAAQERFARRVELVELSTQLLDATAAQIEAGAGTEPDRLRAKLVYEQSKIDLDAARFGMESARRVLSSSVGVDMHIDLPLVSTLDDVPNLLPLEDLIATADERNGRVIQARIAVSRASMVHKLAQSMAMPDVFASAGPRYSDIDSETTIDVGVGIEIPIFDRNQGEIRAAMAQRLSAAANLEIVKQVLHTEVSVAWATFETAAAAARRYQNQLIPLAEETLELTRFAFQSGSFDYLRLLDAQQVLIESRIAYVNSLQQLHIAATELNELTQIDAPWRMPLNEDPKPSGEY